MKAVLEEVCQFYLITYLYYYYMNNMIDKLFFLDSGKLFKLLNKWEGVSRKGGNSNFGQNFFN